MAQRSIFGHTKLVQYETMDEYYEGRVHPINNYYAMAEIGLFYGVSNHILYPPFIKMYELFENSSSNIYSIDTVHSLEHRSKNGLYHEHN